MPCRECLRTAISTFSPSLLPIFRAAMMNIILEASMPQSTDVSQKPKSHDQRDRICNLRGLGLLQLSAAALHRSTSQAGRSCSITLGSAALKSMREGTFGAEDVPVVAPTPLLAIPPTFPTVLPAVFVTAFVPFCAVPVTADIVSCAVFGAGLDAPPVAEPAGFMFCGRI